MATAGFYLDPLTHDLALGTDGRMRFLDADVQTEADTALVQEIKTRLLFYRGEGFTDVREGVPYYQEILKKGIDLPRIKSILRRVILSVPGVVDVPRLEITTDAATRTASVVFEARTIAGRIVRSEDFGALVID